MSIWLKNTLETSVKDGSFPLETSWKHLKTTLEKSGKDTKTTLETSVKTSGKDPKTTLETSIKNQEEAGEAILSPPIHSPRTTLETSVVLDEAEDSKPRVHFPQFYHRPLEVQSFPLVSSVV